MQYHIERYLAGTVEGDSATSVFLPERLSATRKWREAWVNFAHTKVYQAPDQSSLGQGIANGPVYVRRLGPNIPWGFVECRILKFGLLPSTLRKSNGREWTLTDLPPFHNFACDYDQDLLVLVSKYVLTSFLVSVAHRCCADAWPTPKSRSIFFLPTQETHILLLLALHQKFLDHMSPMQCFSLRWT